MNTPLQQLLEHPALWQASRGRELKPSVAARVIATGHPPLDTRLHDGGWPQGATTELLGPIDAGAFRLLLPTLRQLQQRPWLVFLAPPYIPNGPALTAAGINLAQLLIIKPRNLRELLWCANQTLSSGSCAAVVTWANRLPIGNRDLRRLQQAAHQGNSWHVLLRSEQFAQEASPSALRIVYNSKPTGDLQLQIIKQRGGWSGQSLQLSLTPELQQRCYIPPPQLPVHLAGMPSLAARNRRYPHR